MLPPKVTAVGVASLFSNLALQGQGPLERALLTAVLYQLILSEFYEIKVARLHLVWILTVAVVSESTLKGQLEAPLGLTMFVAIWMRVAPFLPAPLNTL